ncbi:SGNH/GDSL hydrolase family protein [Paractinoplanes lichenicola]|uniref:SGNH/GDSL hydrolase family protein n=1 Tax=Paractinoplanes lichenicola TaxID=2802976 RepID=A0ABS1VWV8_9ACTN|nr:SGNH/GDSL hydrolase family protein [Actinoplanes lichenicola]MBL7258959.1 SGNH/GDSL hydrolase family protein [Actinoplanes lichenicola]
MPTRRELLALTSGAAVTAATGLAVPTSASAHQGDDGDWTVPGWIATWAAAPTTVPPNPPSAPTVLANQTVRHVVHCSAGGDEIRIRVTNEFGQGPLRLGAVRVALRQGDGASTAIVPGSDRRVTFGNRAEVTLPAGSPLLSDPVRLRVPPGGDLAISLYLPARTPATTLAAFAFQDNVIADGDVTAARTVTPVATIGQYLFLSGVAVRDRGAAIVTLGDSITNGANTQNNLNHRWPDLLGARLRSAGLRRGIANVGISGNRLLHDPNPAPGSDAETFAAYFGHSGLRRFDRDVIAQPGAEYLIVLLGVNDLGHPGTVAPLSEVVSADDLIGGHRQLIARAHAAGLVALGGTILPFKGDTLGFYTEANERKREVLNRWIRSGGEYDGVIDFDRAMGDPADPLRLNPAYDSGDHLHPNDAGMAAMAAAVPLRVFK